MSQPDHHHPHATHFSRRGYLTSFAISAVLTAIPFWLVMSGILTSTAATVAAIVIFAVAQIVVQTVGFLHLNARDEGGWTLMAYAFTVVMVVIVIAGSLWIMYHLNSNMMPMAPVDGTP